MMPAIAAFVERDVKLGLSYPSTLLMPFVSAVVTVWGFAFLARIVNPHAPLDAGNHRIDYFTYVIVNLAFMLLLNTALQAVPAALRRDQVAGTLETMVASPTPLIAMVIASAVWPIFFAILQASAYLLCAAAFGLQLSHVDVRLLFLFLLLGVSCTSALGVLFAAGVIAFKQQPPFTLMSGTAATLLAGVLFPISLLPAPLRMLSWLLPLTHALRGLRAAVAGAPAAPVLGDALWLTIASAVLLPAACAALSAALNRAKCEGTLSAY